MVFFKEEIAAFNIAYFDKLCAALDSESEIRYYCRDTFPSRKGLVPDSDKDALELITLVPTHRYMYDTRLKRSKWGLMSTPHDLLDECADRILAKVVGTAAARKAMEEAERKATEEATRRFEAALRLAAEEPLNQEEVARMTESNPMRARFSSLEELTADILTKGLLAKNHGSTPADSQ